MIPLAPPFIEAANLSKHFSPFIANVFGLLLFEKEFALRG
jgi:hypothetical protein